METTDRVAEGTAAIAQAQGREMEGGALTLPAKRPGWTKVAWWSLALLVVSVAALLAYAFPAFAQAGGDRIDTCSAAGGVGGEGGQKILDGIKNIALFAAATVGSIAVIGLIASALMIILGSTSKDW